MAVKKPAKRATKGSAKRFPQLTGYSKGEYIKVVPLHAPKPTIAIGELARARQRASDPALFDGRAPVAAPAAHLTYFGGPLLTNVQVYTIFWGKKWSAAPGAGIATRLNAFYSAILVSPLIDQLAEYNVLGQSIGHGSLLGSKVITANAPAQSVTDTT